VYKSGVGVEFLIEKKGYEMKRRKSCLPAYGTNFVD